MVKLNFQQPLLQSCVSGDPSEIIQILIWGSRIFDVENIIVLLSMFLETVIAYIYIFFFTLQESLINIKFKRRTFICYRNLIEVFTLIFNRFNASLLNNSIKRIVHPKMKMMSLIIHPHVVPNP